MALPRLDDYKYIVGENNIEEIKSLSKIASKKRMKHVNSTSMGGGVAEILHRLVPLLNEVGVKTKWEVIKGGSAFFAATKAFHNALHGSKTQLREEMFETFVQYNELNADEMEFDEDVIMVHDPQPVALVQKRGKTNAKWIWRCHIDVSNPDTRIWNFIERYIQQYDAAVFSAPQFSQNLRIPQFMIPPSIDPYSDKNKDLEEETINSIFERFEIQRDKPVITQISRFDRLKNPLGVIDAYKMVKKFTDCSLVLAGGGAEDDPEGISVFQEVKEASSGEPDIRILLLPSSSDIEINALQRGSTVIIQNSEKEGFGLTVTEALWKRKPVIATPKGGIPLQVLHGITGFLAHTIDGLAYYIRYLLANPDVVRSLGEAGHEHVKRNFLITGHLRRYLLLLITLDYPKQNIIYIERKE